MKILGFVLLVFAGLVPAVAFAAAPPAIWTARTAVAFARTESPDSEMVRQRFAAARAVRQQAEAAYYPRVELSGSYTQTDNPMYSFGNILNQGNFQPGINFNDPGRTDDLGFELGANYRLYNGGRDRAGVDAATAGVQSSAAAGETVLQQLEFEVYRAYRRIAEAGQIVEARRASLEAADAALGVAKARYEAGDLLKLDLLNLKLQRAQAEESLIRAHHDLALAKTSFLALLGLPDGEVTIAVDEDDLPVSPVAPDIATRPELQRLSAAQRAVEAELTSARGGRLPTLDGFASIRHDQGTLDDGSGDSWMAGVKLNLNLFDGHLTSAKVAQNQARLAAIKAERSKLERSLQLDLKRAELALDQARQSKEVTMQMVEQASEGAKLSRARYSAGVILTSELIDNENRLTEARVRDALAASALAIAAADLRRAAGVPLFDRPDSNSFAVETQP